MSFSIEQLDEVTVAPGLTVSVSGMTLHVEVDEDGRVIEIRCDLTAPHKPLVLWGSEPDHFLRGLYLALRTAVERECKDQIAEEARIERQRRHDGDRDLADRFSRDYA